MGESKLLQQSQQNQTYTATLTGDNNIPPVNTSTTGVVNFVTNAQYNNNNELYCEINLTNIHNDVVRVDVHFGKDGENGPALVTLYQKTTCLSSEIVVHPSIQNMKKQGCYSMERFLLKPLNLDHYKVAET